MSMKKLSVVEAKLFLRDPAGVFWGLFFPTLLLVGLSFIPGAREPSPDLGGLRLVDVYLPIVLGAAMATFGVAILPVIMAKYREFGFLRRLAVTPVRPRRLLIAQLLVHGAFALLSSLAALGVAMVAFDVPLPGNPVWFVVALALMAAAMFALGLVVGAVAPSVSAGQNIGLLLYFPMLFFAGVYFPREAMSEGLRTVSDLTPIGAGVQALKDSWWGTAPALSNLLVMAVAAVVLSLVAAKLFRWE